MSGLLCKIKEIKKCSKKWLCSTVSRNLESSWDMFMSTFSIHIDECSASPSPCDVNAYCRNNVGSYVCSCKAGFSGDGKSCTRLPNAVRKFYLSKHHYNRYKSASPPSLLALWERTELQRYGTEAIAQGILGKVPDQLEGYRHIRLSLRTTGNEAGYKSWHIYYGDAMLVPLRGTPTWRPEINENIWNSLLLWEWLLFPRELAYIHINISPNNILQLFKLPKIIRKDLFSTRQLCHGAILMSRTGEILKIQDAIF